ncbi:RecQ family ATP-dependent DNA helicase [Brevibacillus reuszeri]|uniref:RecQ family ATP-dependent DNA helicase n=1 Tax=Brevibacillus reuszeri TaxID=54915 RepID=UPI0028A08C1A|nr:ATP-dependent DNA helicase RecQ [Brevibacillus reuszeri]
MSDLLQRALSKHFGHPSFRPGQEDMIRRVMSGRNVLGLLATGGGKSVTYQLPALLLPGMTIVVSPLISLMIDQVQQLRVRSRIPVAYINSSQDPAESRELLREIGAGKFKLLYISPEKLQQPYVQEVLRRARVSLVAIDEAHCISQWGHDFRTDYLRLPEVIKKLGNPPVLAVTATATKAVRNEICDLLNVSGEDVIVQPLNRANIAQDLVVTNDEGERRERVLEMMNTLEGPGIVYCSTRQAVEVLTATYQLEGNRRVHGYHGGMNSMERMLIQQQFLANELDIIVATNAFGMGIDKSDIRFVIHYQLPASMEAYAQEIGRVGRDGRPGYAVLFCGMEDVQIHQHMLEREYPSQLQVQQFCQLLSTGTQITSEALASIDISEEMAGLLSFYTEKAAYSSKPGSIMPYDPDKALGIWQVTQARKKQKQQKLFGMLDYVQSSECLRRSINQYFEEAEYAYTLQCCSRCGLDRAVYNSAANSEQEKKDEKPWNLRQALQILLPKR